MNETPVVGGTVEAIQKTEALEKAVPYLKAESAMDAVHTLLNTIKEQLTLSQDLQRQKIELEQYQTKIESLEARVEQTDARLNDLAIQLEQVIDILVSMRDNEAATLNKLDSYLDKWR